MSENLRKQVLNWSNHIFFKNLSTLNGFGAIFKLTFYTGKPRILYRVQNLGEKFILRVL